MRIALLIALKILAINCFAADLSTPQMEEADNLLPNPTFKCENGSAMPSGWWGNCYSKNQNATIAVKKLDSGVSGISICGFDKDVSAQVSHAEMMPVKEGNSYKFSVQVKSSVPEVTIYVRWSDDRKKLLAQDSLVFKVATDKVCQLDIGKAEVCHFPAKENGELAVEQMEMLPKASALKAPPKSCAAQIIFPVAGISAEEFWSPCFSSLEPLQGKQVDSAQKTDADAEELRRLLVGHDNKEELTPKAQGLTVDIRDFNLPESYEPPKWKYPESATNIRIAGSNFFRNDSPVFLLGVESTVINFPLEYRMRGYDIIHLNDLFEAATTRLEENREKNKLVVRWEQYGWLDKEIEMLLNHGIAVYAQPIEGKWFHNNELAKKYFPEALTSASHFFDLRPDDPTGLRLRENFWKSILCTTRKYPVAIYELFNEVRYCDYSPYNISLFRDEMRKKYGSIESANAIWGTKFASFDEMEPPRKSASYSADLYNIKPRGFSRILWIDWAKFIERRFGEILCDFRSFVKRTDKNPNVYLGVQSFLDPDNAGLGGVAPREKAKAEDVYILEGNANAWPQEEGFENINEIKSMLIPGFNWNLIDKIVPDKPILGVECDIRGAAKNYDPDAQVLNLNGKWRFKEDNDRSGEREGFASPGFQDRAWQEIEVPGMWGRQGFPNCFNGWYRKRFSLPPNGKGRKVFLNGEELADCSKIYLNGTLLFQTKKWDERFGLDVTGKLKADGENVLAIEIENRYMNNGLYWGGIRGFISLDRSDFGSIAPVSEGMMRNWLWGMAVNGHSGVIMSYDYTPNGDVGNNYNPERKSFAAAKAIPEVKNELNSVGSVILPRPRLKGEIAIIYPFESGRIKIPKDNRDWLHAGITRDIMDYYMAVLMNQVDIDVIDNDLILQKGLKDYKAVIVASCPRVKDGVMAKLEEYVKDGGNLIVDYSSLKKEDDFNKDIDASSLLGAKTSAVFNEARKVSSTYFAFEGACVGKEGEESLGASLKPFEGTKILARYEDGTPAITLREQGRGKVYNFACNLGFKALRPVFKRLLHEIGAEPRLQLRGGGYELL